MHPFEKAGFGAPPYKFLGYSVEKFQAIPGDPSCPIQAGASCDYCGQAIMNVCHLRSASGRKFKVGCDCVAKALKTDGYTPTAADKAIAKRVVSEARKTREAALLAEIPALLEQARPVLASAPHPNEWRASLGETAADAIEWRLRASGAAGKMKVLKELRAIVQATI